MYILKIQIIGFHGTKFIYGNQIFTFNIYKKNMNNTKSVNQGSFPVEFKFE